MFEERVQKAMARLGFGSRREIERWIQQGRVKVNGGTIELGTKVTEGDQVQCNGRRVTIKQPDDVVRVLAYNKPEGEICTRKDEQGRRTVYQNLPGLPNSRWVSIGRLDINTSGLLLFTNSGELANRLMHPSNEIEREYAVRVNGEVNEKKLRQLTKGVKLEDGMAKFDGIEDAGGQGANHWYHVILKEGRNREVRRLWEAVDTRVSRLIRIRYASFELPRSIRQGKSAELEFEYVEQLCALVGLKCDKPKPRRATGRGRRQSPWAKAGKSSSNKSSGSSGTHGGRRNRNTK
jgi:23S rRNA pseudouridine2605 synthase